MNSLLTACFVYRKIILPCIVITGLTVTINNCLVSVNGDTKIRKRYLVHPPPSDWAATKMQLIAGLGLPMDVDVSTIIGYVVKFNYDLPYNASDLTEPYIRYQRSTYHRNPEGFSSRWEIYRMIESTLVGFSSGRSCLLRVICETAAVPFSRSQGILPQLIHILLTPSLTEEKYLEHTNQEFRAAELKGRKYPGDCHKIFPDCTESPLDYFTERVVNRVYSKERQVLRSECSCTSLTLLNSLLYLAFVQEEGNKSYLKDLTD
ncbi:uncharacterized protein LOC141535329 [Cotesia typhae]|uniref:uncharacterized protein LOC141535329 n=1 Tax=Cotesia typhae TaxID=2053667 RepID=UPI003D69D90B